MHASCLRPLHSRSWVCPDAGIKDLDCQLLLCVRKLYVIRRLPDNAKCTECHHQVPGLECMGGCGALVALG